MVDVMQSSFVPNGGRVRVVGGSYQSRQRIVNDSVMVIDVKAGRALLFSCDSLQLAGYIDKLHVSQLLWAEKAGKVKGRICLNGKKGSNYVALNEGVDDITREQLYPRYKLFSIREVCEPACQRRYIPRTAVIGRNSKYILSL